MINDNVKGEQAAKDTHYEVGTIVRNAIKQIGGTMPEELPTPRKSLKELEKEENKKLVSVANKGDNKWMI